MYFLLNFIFLVVGVPLLIFLVIYGSINGSPEYLLIAIFGFLFLSITNNSMTEEKL